MLEQQHAGFVNDNAVIQRKPDLTFSNSTIPMAGTDWLSVGQIPFSDYQSAMGKGKNWFEEHGTSTLTYTTHE